MHTHMHAKVLVIIVCFIFIICIIAQHLNFNQNVNVGKIKDYYLSFVEFTDREEFLKSLVRQRPIVAHMVISENDSFVTIGRINP